MLLIKIQPRSLVKAKLSKTTPSLKFSPPSCKDCKWSADNGNICILFSLTDNLFDSKLIRKNKDLCGPDAFYFKSKETEIDF
jgi:hypothetical protein